MTTQPTIKEEDMTIFEKAKQIADNGMNREDVYKFFSKTNRDVVEHIGLFQTFGIHQDKTWDLYEDWRGVPSLWWVNMKYDGAAARELLEGINRTKWV